jgi:hypothetical protein
MTCKDVKNALMNTKPDKIQSNSKSNHQLKQYQLQ